MCLSRRTLLAIGGLVMLGHAVVASAPSAVRAQATAQPAPVEEFVGEVAATPSYVGIAIESEPASNSRQVTAYVCDGRGTAHLFRGPAIDAGFDLTTEDGSARLTGSFGPTGASGTFSAQGIASVFSAVPTLAFGGLYRTTAQDELRATGRSLAGTDLQLEAAPDQSRLLGAVVRPDGTVYRYELPMPERMRTSTEYQENWLIMLNDGRSRGGRIDSSLKPRARFLNVPAG